MSPNLKPLQDCIKLVADIAIDSEKAAGESNSAAKAADFSNVLSDLLMLLPELGQIPNPATLGEADYAALVASLAADLVLPGKPGAIVTASLQLLSDLVSVITPDILAIISASKA